jgi:hypothetical protein
MIAYRAAFLGTALALALISAAKAGPEECQQALNGYNTAIGSVADALRTYANCIRDSHAHDDCSAAFSTLRSAQDDFESAVGSYGTDCQ